MKIPYTLHFYVSQVIKQNITIDKLPKSCNYSLKFAQKNNLYKSSNFLLVQQIFNYKPFYIDLVEIDSDKSLDYGFEIREKQLFMFFMLEGRMDFYDKNNIHIVKTVENNFLMSYFDSGKYSVKVKSGKQIALVIALDPEWLEKISFDYKNLRRILCEFNNPKNFYQVMYQGKMEKNIHRWLRNVYNSQKQDIGIFDGFLRTHMALMLKHYNNLLDNYWLAVDIRNYLLTYLTDENLCLTMVCAHFNLSQRVLNYHFGQVFGKSINSYINFERTKMALIIMEKEDSTISQIYSKVGYRDESSLRYHYNRFKKNKNVVE